MVVARIACDVQQLRHLLADELSEMEEARATDHVAQCSTCQSTLADLAASDDLWQQVGDHLRDSRWQDDCTLVLTSGDFNEPSSRSRQSVVTSLDFLEPSDDPAIMGRLGPYEILSVVGSGGFGIVLKGYDRDLNRYVAVKVLAPYLAHNASARQRFAREAKAAAAVVHPNVVAIHAVDAKGKLPFLVMPLISGESLQERLQREGPLETKEILRIGMQVAQGLAAAHSQGVVHRDVKPANILLEPGVDRVLLTDFGLARAMDDAALTCSTVIAGTPQYMSPEQARGDTVDHRTDLFSLGSVLYEISTGHPPFRAETLMGVLRRIADSAPRDVRESNPEVPGWLAAIIAKLHSANASDRYESAAEVATLCEQCLAHLQQPTVIALPAFPEKHRPPSETHRSTWLWSAGIIVAILATSLAILAASLALWMSGTISRNPGISNHATTTSKSVTPVTGASPLSDPASGTAVGIDWHDSLDLEFLQIESRLRGLEATFEND